ncbi:type IV pilus assembly protein PilZ [Sporosarcina newyorkensis 2681]|uniref:Type IV pilus assembly protein PilZ n=1 Tax=Sporosarcina newyorkensis 2681 TaxID=1027292 RepID=F9DNU1_9BACL|nr:flagellar brake domain-containing protein [Sporosarcina newyorkensis]EGQ27584.1 type IV pilus assembly protein PilZ [Sporosarcina newyorkensis 2681]
MKLTIGTILTIEKDYKEESEKFKSRVVDIEEDHAHFMMDYPISMETGKTAFFIDGTQLLITFVDNLKMSYAFRTEIHSRMNRTIPMLKLKYPGDKELIKIQRREFVRVETSLDVALQADSESLQLVSSDLSAGGLAVNMKNHEYFPPQTGLDLMIVLHFSKNEIKYISCRAKIVRNWEQDNRRLSSLKFEEIDEKDRQQIIRYCFERQLELRNS